jgi:hypothetical protein
MNISWSLTMRNQMQGEVTVLGAMAKVLVQAISVSFKPIFHLRGYVRE